MNQHKNRVSMIKYAKKHMQLMQEVKSSNVGYFISPFNHEYILDTPENRQQYIKEFLNDKHAERMNIVKTEYEESAEEPDDVVIRKDTYECQTCGSQTVWPTYMSKKDCKDVEVHKNKARGQYIKEFLNDKHIELPRRSWLSALFRKAGK